MSTVLAELEQTMLIPETPKRGSMVAVEPSSEVVSIDIDACRRLARLIRSHHIPKDREEDPFTWMAPHDLGNFYLLLVAICHQTSPRGRPALEGSIYGRRVRGWDYLSQKLAVAVRRNPQILWPESWVRMTSTDLGELFRDDEMGDLLSDKRGRASLIRDLGRKMRRRSWRYADELYGASSRSVASGSSNLLALLSEFRAYQDPVRKKSFFFLTLMHNAGLWSYTDPSQLGAPIDYHEIRGHLRIGTVKVGDPDLHAALLGGGELTSMQDIQVRTAVHHALMFISEESGLRSPSQLHYLFWNVFRSCCPREQPHCYSCPPTCPLPSRYVHLATLPDGGRHCPFASVCESVGHEPKMLDYLIDTEFY